MIDGDSRIVIARIACIAVVCHGRAKDAMLATLRTTQTITRWIQGYYRPLQRGASTVAGRFVLRRRQALSGNIRPPTHVSGLLLSG
jgi:hypothetical protein